MRLVNPLYYPLAVLGGGVTLFVGVRLVSLPSPVMLPLAIGVAMTGASFLQSRQSRCLELDNPELEREILGVKKSALVLVNQAKSLRLEAQRLLTDTFQVELLTTVSMSCDRVADFPGKFDLLVQHLQGSNSLLSVDELKGQLKEVKQKLSSSSGIAKTHLNQLADSLKRNIKLAQAGEDGRLVRIINISILMQDFAGVSQKLQTGLRTSDLSDGEQIHQLQLVADELYSLSESLDLVVRQ
ncbi:hypothetical protein [Anabaena sp. 4-3]|uniref:hypothetical protein n=1 Tax=Anabaena sp. 4-3 TaxID=1811979 RepID=UPI000A8FD4B5|nr:hypothetical protein [Anabaena sp. 4-3]